MTRPGAAQGPLGRVVDTAHHRADDAVGEIAGDAVQPAQQLGWPGAGDREPAQAVPQRHHAGHRVDAVTGDIPDHEQHFPARQRGRVVPVAADQVPGPGGPVAGGDVEAGDLHRFRGLRGDGLLQPQRQPVLLRGAFLGVGQPVPGRGERHLGVIVGGHILVGAAHRDQRAALVGHRLGERAHLPHALVVGPDDPERGGGLPLVLQQRGAEALHHRQVVGRDVRVKLGHRDRIARRLPEQGERRLGPEHLPGEQVLLPAADPAEPLGLVQQRAEALDLTCGTPGDHHAVVEPGDADLQDRGGQAVGHRRGDDLSRGVLRLAGRHHLDGPVVQAAGQGGGRVDLQQRAPGQGRGFAARRDRRSPC